MERCCGTCKHLDVPVGSITKSGRTHKRLDSMVFNCMVPEPVMPKLPACWATLTAKRSMMCPQYGTRCETWEGRK